MMRLFLVGLCAGLAMCLCLGCDKHDSGLLINDGGWFIGLTIGESPSEDVEYPLFIRIEAHVENLRSGADAPDGSILIFRTSHGTFENGFAEIEKTIVNGDAETTLQVDGEGTCEIRVEFEDEETSVIIAFGTGG